jgi:hypothetical protein
MKSLRGYRPCSAVDKPDPQPYLCAIASTTIALILLTFLAVEPWIACFPLIGAYARFRTASHRVTVS